MIYIIKPEDEGKTVKDILRNDLKLSSTLTRRLKTIADGITLDNVHVTVRAAVKRGQTLSLKTEDMESSPNITPTQGRVDIVYEDNDIIIINKAFGTAVHPSPGHSCDTVANILAWRAKEQNTPFVFRAVNRLDSGTGGLMCIAKNADAGAKLSAHLSQKSIKRVYEAVLCGEMENTGGTIDLPIGICDGSGIKRCVRADGESAVTHYKVLERKNGFTRAEIELKTGRTHQIRVHFSHLGHPVWGDFMYGVETSFNGWALFSKSISFVHPTTQENISLSVPVPEFFDKLMEGKGDI